jgi:lysozyme family protein
VKANFSPSLGLVLCHEGGYVHDRRDPGGATNKGVTQRVYDDWRRSKGLEPRSVRSLEQTEVEAIYRKLYWDRIRGDELPSGVDYAAFDFAVNSGTNRAARYLQRAVGVTDDGQIGPMTLAAVANTNPRNIIGRLCAARQDFLETLSTFPTFGGGWTRRVSEVERTAMGMAA